MKFKVAAAALLKIVVIVLATMLLTLSYEAAETAWLPHISQWQSHALTVVYCGFGAFLFALIAVRLQQRAVVLGGEQNADAVIKQLPGFACIINQQGKFVRWNERIEQKLGYSPEEMRQIPVIQTIAEEFRASTGKLMEEAFKAGYGDLESVWLAKDGRRIPCLLTGVRVSIDGEPCIIGTGIDLSAQKQTEEAVRQNEEQYRRLLSNLPDVTWTIDTEGGLHYISPNVEDILGYRPQDVLGGDEGLRISHIHPDDQQLARESFELLFQENRVLDLEYRVRHKDGHWVWIRNRALRSYVLDNRRLTDGVLTDISRGKAAEALDAQLASIVHSSIDAVIGMTVDGVIQSWNPGAEAMFGYSQQEAAGQSIAIVIAPERLHELPEVLQKTKRGERIERFDSLGIRKNGKRFDVSLANSPIVDKSGRILGLSLIAHDIGQRKQAEEAMRRSEAELRRAKDIAENANRQKTHFLSNMSQALRDPMSDILDMIEQTLQTTLTAEQREYLLTVKTEGDGLIALINNLLDYTRSEFGELRLHTAPFLLRDLVRQTVRPLFTEAEQMGLATAFELSPEIPDEVLGDAGRLRQVLSHLVENAVKYTYEGAIALKLACRSQVDHQFELLFTLSDTGIGIPAEKHQQIFEPFTNRRDGTSPRHAGNGLGLAISSRLIELMGGKIWLESKPGRGSTFYFTVRLQLLRMPTAAAAN